MTTPTPGDADRDFEQLLRQYITEEQRNFHTAAIGVVERVHHDSMRVDLELKHEPGAILEDVPIATPFAVDGVGDVPPLRPEDDPEGLVIFTDMPLGDAMLADRGTEATRTGDPNRVEDAVFLPAMIWYDADATPNHDADAAERIIAHPDGPELKMRGGQTLLAHSGRGVGQSPTPPPGGEGDPDSRVRLRLTGDPYGTFRSGDQPTLGESQDRPPWPDGARVHHHDPTHAYDELQLWPRPGGAAAGLEHPSDTHLTLTEQGVAAVPGTTDEGIRRRGLYAGALNDPERVSVRAHRHEVHDPVRPVTDEGVTASGDGTTTTFTLAHSLGESPGHVDVTARSAAAAGQFHVDATTASDVTIVYATAPPAGTDNLVFDVLTHPASDGTDTVTLTTQPLTRREQTARLTDTGERAPLRNASAATVQQATTRAENHRAFVDFYTSGSVDPTDPTLWPSTEHVPHTDEWAAFSDSTYDPATFEPTADEQGATIGFDDDRNA